jgi:cytosine/adenosine deaminase-related metal-dependent hydrolase
LVLPISQPPIENGAVVVGGGLVQAAGRWRDLGGARREHVIDLGEVVLLPGLVNAHCHLDYTDMAGLLPPLKSFPDWIKSILALKAGWTYSDFAQSWVRGAQMLARTGTTSVADIEAAPELLPEVWEATPLRVHSFLEMTGVRSRRAPEAVMEETTAKAASLPMGRCRAGLSPHAPYSTTPALLRLCAAASAQQPWRLAMHVAESPEEFKMFTEACGPMFDWLRRNDRDMSDCGLGSPVAHLERCSILTDHLIAVHVNHLAPGDKELLSRRRVHVVHCPRSHRYFNHQRFPLDALAQAGVNLCLGTDSLATVLKGPRDQVELNLFAEMQALTRSDPGLAPEKIMQMATVNGARALGRPGELGELSAGSAADLIALDCAPTLREVWEAVVHCPGQVRASMIGGQWTVAPPELPAP